MPQIENVTKNKTRIPEGGYPNGVKHEKKASLDEFTRLTDCHRKSAVRLLCSKQVMVYVDGKPEKRRPSNRKGKRVYTDEVINTLHLVWTFF